MSDIDLDAIEARANAATPGPWVWGDTLDDYKYSGQMVSLSVRLPEYFGREPALKTLIETDSGHYPPRDADRAFIAHARTDIPALIARVREQEQEIARLRQDKAMLDEVYAAYKSGLVQGSGHGYVDVMLRIDRERSARA